jgi:hypothetical protein
VKRKAISFVVDDKEKIQRYAKEKGFENASALARFATIQYMNRYPRKDAKDVQPQYERDD